MVSFNPLDQRLGSLSIKESLRLINYKGLLVGSLLLGGAIVVVNEVMVQTVSNTIVSRNQLRGAELHPQYQRATLVPKTKPDFVKRWEATYGKKQE